MLFRKLIFVLIFALSPFLANAQITPSGIVTFPSAQLSGVGAPSAYYNCNTTTAGVSYIDTTSGITTGRLWLCDASSGSLAWDHQVNGTQSIITGTSTVVGTLLLGGCNTTTTVTVPGVTTANGIIVTPIFLTPPTGNVGLLNVTGWVSAANTVSIQACAFGSLSGVPNFIPKIQVQ